MFCFERLWCNFEGFESTGVGNIIIAHLNINSLRNKFDSLVQLISGSVDILVIGETKLDSTFPKKQFIIEGFKEPYRNDRNGDGGGVMIYVRDDIPCQEKETPLSQLSGESEKSTGERPENDKFSPEITGFSPVSKYIDRRPEFTGRSVKILTGDRNSPEIHQ